MANKGCKEVFDSDEYKMLKTDRYIILDENNTELLSKTSSSKSGKDFIEDTVKINLSVLKSKFENLNITYEEIFDFYKKVSSKQNFYKNVIMTYNVKQINLESQKDNYSKRINNIVTKHKNINYLMKTNSKVENIMKKFLNLSHKTQIEKSYNFDYLQSQNIKDFYKKCERLINTIKTSFEFFCSMYISIYNSFEDVKEDLIEVKSLPLLISKIKAYFKKIAFSEQTNKSSYIESLFMEFNQKENIEIKKFLTRPDLLKANIGDSIKIDNINKISYFVQLYVIFLFN